MHVHILGICGTFMGGVAALAKAAGHQVSGVDENVYPPMSTQLRKLGIRLEQGYDGSLPEDADVVVVGNVLSRGNPTVENLLNSRQPYLSGPEWLAQNVLRDKWVIAVAGTHGKTTTTSMLAWILDYAGLEPGFLVGGVPANFGISARLGRSKYFVVEADEYDTAFFDKRAKFVHYRPRTLAITNIEYDHADIYSSLGQILRQFHHLIRTVPGEGLITANGADPSIDELLEMGVWTRVETFSATGASATWTAEYELVGAKSRFTVSRRGQEIGEAGWSLLGEHNLENALAAISAANHVGVRPDVALEALEQFKGVRRRMEKRGVFRGVTVYEDFAHHPTAIRRTLAALRSQQGDRRIVAVVEPRSNTMRMGVHRESLPHAFDDADLVYVLAAKDLGWDAARTLESLGDKLAVERKVEMLVSRLVADLRKGDQVLLMSNGSFQGLPRLLQQELQSDPSAPVTDA
jgi:UDP-N-acetylmuramate: L-alanyl-gamma-D-glutamyl-meso-diaminopimelate ligase